jgi:hypothetical protein
MSTMAFSHAPEHIWTVVTVVALLYAALIAWMLRLMRQNKRRDEAALAMQRERK